MYAFRPTHIHNVHAPAAAALLCSNGLHLHELNEKSFANNKLNIFLCECSAASTHRAAECDGGDYRPHLPALKTRLRRTILWKCSKMLQRNFNIGIGICFDGCYNLQHNRNSNSDRIHHHHPAKVKSKWLKPFDQHCSFVLFPSFLLKCCVSIFQVSLVAKPVEISFQFDAIAFILHFQIHFFSSSNIFMCLHSVQCALHFSIANDLILITFCGTINVRLKITIGVFNEINQTSSKLVSLEISVLRQMCGTKRNDSFDWLF